MEADRETLSEAFAKLLETTPFDCIRPEAVADAAGVPASSFPYHFKDVYAAADALMAAEEDTVIRSGIRPETGGEAFLLSVSFILRYPASAKHLCLSSGGGIYKKHVSSLAGRFFSEVALARLDGRAPTDRERCAVRFLRAAAVGLASRELISADDVRAAADSYTDFFDMITDSI